MSGGAGGEESHHQDHQSQRRHRRAKDNEGKLGRLNPEMGERKSSLFKCVGTTVRNYAYLGLWMIKYISAA